LDRESRLGLHNDVNKVVQDTADGKTEAIKGKSPKINIVCVDSTRTYIHSIREIIA